MKTNHDQAQIFLIYMALVGDVQKTALALDLEENVVQKLADENGWTEKVRRISIMSKSASPGDWERAQNRALNFVQCHQLRRQIDRLLFALSAEEDITRPFIKNKKVPGTDIEVPELNARFLSDLTASMDRIHAMTYAALADTPKERTERKGDDPDPTASQGIHSAVISALNGSKAPLPAATLADAAAAKVEQLKSANTEPECLTLREGHAPSA